MSNLISLIIAVLLFSCSIGFSQTCCSGGVPVSANIGLPPADGGTFHIGISYDLNILRTLKNESETLIDRTRERQTQSVLLELGYSVTDRFSIDLLTAYVTQRRNIQVNGFTDEDISNGIGDLVLLAKYQFINSQSLSWSLGAGPKFPLGASDLRDANGLTLVADLQPGSGALDWLVWSQLSFPVKWRPTMNASMTFVRSFKGKNDAYLGVQTYQFGDETQFSVGLADQFLIGSQIVESSAILRYRKAKVDEIDAFVLPNTGGEWIFLSPSIGTNLSPKTKMSLSVDLPLMANVVGTQLSPSIRWNLGAYIQLSKSKFSPLN